MKPDKTTKFLLAAIAFGLFLNALVNSIPAALAMTSVYIDGGTVEVRNNRYDPIYVKCIDC